ncbi:inner centromere protein A-like [Cataglyphis hispanica]|uniref:inner centromere protein A-like n=1 Tax=Cataglyphis hispanica TaxID=1086592 RepID=UPI0021805D68|nr:inner centromere protein A-like [Cataglyphis hispanica]
MESRTRILIFCLLYIARASQVPAGEIEFRGRLPRAEDVKNLSRLDTLVEKTDGIDRQSAYKLRDKRALGLLLSGLAQIFGYTVTPIQIASLPNPTNITRPAAMSNSSMMGNIMGQQTTSIRPTSMNDATMPRQQETIRFTGVLNFGNNSDIIGHLQRYEQIFHGRQNNATNTMTTLSQPVSMPPAKISLDPTTNSVTRPPLLAPFFVRIPLPIAPDLPPATIPIEDFRFSYPTPTVSIASESNKTAEMPIRKEEETIYRKKENTERYTVEEKDIYDEKDVMKPVNHYTHQLLIDEPSSQQNGKQQRKQEKHERLKEQEEQRNCNKNIRYKENEIKEKDRKRKEEIANRNREEEIVNRNREKEIANRNRKEKIANQNRGEEIDNRNREHASRYESMEKRKPAYNDEEDEDSAERYEERISQANKSSKQPLRETENEEVEDDDSNEQFRGHKQPENFDKYIEVGYNQQLPIGDYFHEGDPEVIRDSYGEVLDDKKLEDDRIAGYINMFKHPYVYDSQSVRNPEDASGEDENEESTADAYDEHLTRLQKLREEYALPKMKYEEYDLNDENEAKRDGRGNERIQNHTSTRSKTGRIRGKEDNRAKMSTGPRQNILRNDAGKFGKTKSQDEIDFMKHVTPLIVPIRYIDTNDNKVQQATTRQLSYEESDKLPSGRFSEDNIDSMRTLAKEKLTPQIGLPERPRKLHEGEHKELQVWPPPFDFAFDNTAPTNTIISPNSQNYPSNYYRHVKDIAADDANSDNSSEQLSGNPVNIISPNSQKYPSNYYQHVKNIAANDANSDNSSEQPSGYLVVVGNPYRYPYNVYYFPNENTNSQNRDSYPSTESAHQRNQIYAPQQTNQHFIQANSNLTEHNLNKTTRDHYQQPHQAPTNVLDRYKYIFGQHTPEAKESVNIDTREQIPVNIENWSSKIYQPRSRVEQSPPVLAQLQNVASLNQNVQSRFSNSRYLRPIRRQKRSQPEEQRKDDGKIEILQPIPISKPFDDPQSAHDFFGFNKDDYSFAGESSDAFKVAEENGKITKESDVPLDPLVYHRDNESVVKHTDEPENDTEKAKVTEYRNKVATLKVSEQRQLKPNGPIYYVDFVRNI